ncbi:ester cyclase [Kutzneria viridogrisea]|uniref:Ester cyclase n=2 Tax=Kutzneria TaxID=43356 RepID=W5WEL8_9PSEU|nr:ester cyclase [Kutzneria albida]AHH99623.1 hypothetical protein KALB_6263 [Kutzneria albida DSM 43870]MBA8922821.1 putative ester cyclase [Kutzneria viridogrisea]
MQDLGQRARWITDQLFNLGNLDAARTCAPDFLGHLPDYPDAHGPDGLAEFVRGLRTSFPDFGHKVHVSVWEGDQVFLRSSLTGTQRGEFLGIPPTNLPVLMSEMLWLRFDADGRLAELWRETNPVAALDQIGVVPPDGVGPAGRFGHTLKTVARLAALTARQQLAQRRSA